jgi:hypothetical protein
MTITMTREQAAATVASVTAERDGIEANLLDLDDSFGKRLLAGAPLVGESKRRWESAAADLTTLWEIFPAYTAVVNRAADMLTAGRHLSGARLAELSALLSGAPVRVARERGPLEDRDLAASGHSDLTLAAAVHEMQQAFARVAEVVHAAESVWNTAAAGLNEIVAALSAAQQQAHGLRDDDLAAALAAAQADLARLRELLNSDPLALWNGQVDDVSVNLLRRRAGAACARARELVRLRDEAQQRIEAAAGAVAAALDARRAAVATRERAAAMIAAPTLPPPPADAAELIDRLAAADTLRAAERWGSLAAGLDTIETEASAARQRYQDAEQAAAALVDRRDELRGVLEAYHAKAARLAAPAPPDAVYHQARDLLGAAPCDLTAAEAAVFGYEQAVRALSGPR